LSDANLTTLAVTLSLTSVALQTKTARAVTACELVRHSSMNADDHRSQSLMMQSNSTIAQEA
jgi:hypothetical protein